MQLRLEERQREACQKAAVALYFDLVTRLINATNYPARNRRMYG